MTRTELKKLSKEEFMKLPGATEDLYIAVQMLNQDIQK